MPRLTDDLRPGQRVFVPGMSGESALLAAELQADPERAAGVTFCGVQFPGIDRLDYLAVHPQARLQACFMSPAVRRGLAEQRAELLPLDYRGLVRHLHEAAPFDLVVAQLTPPDDQGWCDAGLSADFVPLVWSRARRRVAHLNPRLPRIGGSFRVHRSEIDVAVEAAMAPLEFHESAPRAVDQRIGAFVAGLVHDGDTLQFGIGAVPLALGGALRGHRRLRFQGGMLPGAARTLWEAGALDPEARLSTGLVLGDAALHGFAAGLRGLWLTDASHTHDPLRLAATPRFVAINSAVEVDLFGQVNAERADGRLAAGAGGLPAFAQAAFASAGGRLLICLPSTARGGSASRIVPSLGSQALCTLPQHLADVVVTEHGVAELRGRSFEERARALIDIADPAHRAMLAEGWDTIRRGL